MIQSDKRSHRRHVNDAERSFTIAPVATLMSKRLASLPVVVAGLVALVVVGARFDYVPVWDGRIYAGCAVAAAERYALATLRCADHASQAYIAVAGLVQKLAPASPIPVLTTNGALFVLACIGFHRLSRLTFPEAEPFDHALITAAFTAQPAFLASLVQPGLDLPLLPTFVWAVVYIVERRLVRAMLCGLALAFTKESGVLMFAVIAASYVCWFVLRADGTLADRLGGAWRHWVLAIPGFVFVLYLGVRTVFASSGQVIWHTGTTNEPLVRQFFVPRLDLYQVNYAALILILNFAWVVSGVMAADAFVGAVRRVHGAPHRPVATGDTARLGFLTLLMVTVGYALTRFTTFGHTRYFLTVTALLLLPFYGSLVRLSVPLLARRAVLASYVVLLLLSVTRTIDPISRRLYGTFAFGSHELLRMTRITGECCGAGQDQLVYNLQFTAFHDLLDDALAAAAPPDSGLLVVPNATGWILIRTLDRSTHRRTIALRGTITPLVLEPRHVLAADTVPAVGHYIALPNGDDVRARADLSRRYSLGPARVFEKGGYRLAVYDLTRLPPDQ